MFLLIAPVVENIYILAGIYFIFLGNVLDQDQISFDMEFGTQ